MAFRQSHCWFRTKKWEFIFYTKDRFERAFLERKTKETMCSDVVLVLLKYICYVMNKPLLFAVVDVFFLK